MAFRFSLATVLMVRESIEKREELALQRVQFEIAQTRRRVESLTAEIARKIDERNAALQQPTHARQLHAILAEMNASIQSRQGLTESLSALEQEREKRMKAYQAAHADHQMLLEMQAEQRTNFDRDEARSQQKFLDEIFSARSSRR